VDFEIKKKIFECMHYVYSYALKIVPVTNCLTRTIFKIDPYCNTNEGFRGRTCEVTFRLFFRRSCLSFESIPRQ
jgi:hypothetical protein